MMGLRALTLIRPMAAAIVHGSKRIENRSQNLPRSMRGVPTIVAVHAGKKWSDGYLELMLSIDGVVVHPSVGGRVLPYADHLEDEGIVGLMRLTGRVFTASTPPPMIPYPIPLRALRPNPWWGGPFGYEIDAAIAFPSPIPCRGMQGFWPVPAHIEDMISLAGLYDDLIERLPASASAEVA